MIHQKRTKDFCLCGTSVFGVLTSAERGLDAVDCPDCLDVRGENLVHQGPVDLDTAARDEGVWISKYLCPAGCRGENLRNADGVLFCQGCGQSYRERAA